MSEKFQKSSYILELTKSLHYFRIQEQMYLCHINKFSVDSNLVQVHQKIFDYR